MKLSDQDLEALSKLAKEATPGPWAWKRDNMHSEFNNEEIIKTDSGVYPPEDNDRAYLVRCIPQTMIALCREVLAARKMRDACKTNFLTYDDGEYGDECNDEVNYIVPIAICESYDKVREGGE